MPWDLASLQMARKSSQVLGASQPFSSKSLPEYHRPHTV
ncbi:hypothetical protein SGRIM128S_03009 [Streptomyces griseomycini]